MHNFSYRLNCISFKAHAIKAVFPPPPQSHFNWYKGTYNGTVYMKINCINFSFSAHLYHMQTAATSPGMNWGWNTETLLTNLNAFKHRQVILTRQTTSHSSLALSGTDWESASVGLRKMNLEESDLGYSVKKVPKERGIYSFWSHTSMNQDLHPWWQRTTCWFQLLPLTISSYTQFC